MRTAVGFFLLFHSCFCSFAQPDSISLNEITIISYFKSRLLFRVPSSAGIIDSSVLRSQGEQSLVNVVNTVAGVRMEERSPGSYRLSIRGSVLRSPFGVRNVKVYVDDLPFTDATGNTYLNLVDVTALQRIEIMKGPDGSLFGNNSGGVMRLYIFPTDSTRLHAFAGLSSYGTSHEYTSLRLLRPRNSLAVVKSWQRSEGYRTNSSLDRKYYHITDRFLYGKNSELRVLFMLSYLQYKTPGGLTSDQYNENPRGARPSTAILPGAEEQHSGVKNNTIYAGVVNKTRLNQIFTLSTGLFGSDTKFLNPFITTYEKRKENNAGTRLWVEASYEFTNVTINWNTGVEFQQNFSRITNYGNRFGNIDTLQHDVKFKSGNGFAFSHVSTDFFRRLMIDLSLSYNFNQYNFSYASTTANTYKKTFTPQWMPRVAMSYLIIPQLTWRGVVSKGYSTPTLAEIYASGNVLNTDLQPESGINYESGFRFRLLQERIVLDASAFYYQLKNAIVRRQNEGGQEFFTNAGRTNQWGIEGQMTMAIIKNKQNGFIRGIMTNSAYTWHYFLFSNYISSEGDLSGNRVTGVPEQVVVNGLTLVFPFNIYAYAQHNYTSAIPLNDANTVFASSYNLIQVKTGWKWLFQSQYIVEIYMGVDNLLDEKYSLGNDLNAAGGRYYNAAPPRNYFAGLNIYVR